MLWTLFTHPEQQEVLLRFYRKVRPHVAGWRPVAALASDVPATRDLGGNLLNWALGCAMVYCALFGLGKLMLSSAILGIALLVLAGLAAAALYARLSRLTPDLSHSPPL